MLAGRGENDEKQFLECGKIVTTQGIKGEVRVTAVVRYAGLSAGF
jgi:ribosomal 30S subunit maturation factor RimM